MSSRCIFAVMAAGGVAAPISTRASGDELRQTLAILEPAIMVVDGSLPSLRQEHQRRDADDEAHAARARAWRVEGAAGDRARAVSERAERSRLLG